MKNYREYIRERKDVLHDKEEKISYIRSKLGLNHEDGMSEPEDDTEFTYVNDKQRNEPNDRLMAQLHGAEYRGMEADYAAKKMAVKANEAEYEKEKLEKKVDKLDKSDKKLEKMIKKIRKAISGKDEEEETKETEEQPEQSEQSEQSDEQQSETSPEESAPEEGSEEPAEETTDTEEGEEGSEEESEEDEGSKNILSKKLDLSWRQRKGNVIREGRMLKESERDWIRLKDFRENKIVDRMIERRAMVILRGIMRDFNFSNYMLSHEDEKNVLDTICNMIWVKCLNMKIPCNPDDEETVYRSIGEYVKESEDLKLNRKEENTITYMINKSYAKLCDEAIEDYQAGHEESRPTNESRLRRGSLIRECRRHQRMHHLFERLHKERVIRDGKTKIKYKTDRADDGFKVSVDNEGHAREVKMTTQEIIDRKKQQKRAQRKRDPKLKQMTRNRLRSARIRKMKGFDD